MKFDELIGEVCLFYGVDNHMFKLDDQVWEARESDLDTSSELSGVLPISGGIFFKEPLALVTVNSYDNSELEGYTFTDEDYHEWLRVGTNYYDDYYPLFVFSYHPKHPSQMKYTPPKPKRIHDHEVNPFDRLFDPRDT